MSARRPGISVVIAAALAAALLLAGCGGSDKSPAEVQREEAKAEAAVRESRIDKVLKVKAAELKRRREHPNQVLAPPKFQGAFAARYEADREICLALDPSEIASTLKIDEDSDSEEIARAYSKTFHGYEEASFEGCLAGLESH